MNRGDSLEPLDLQALFTKSSRIKQQPPVSLPKSLPAFDENTDFIDQRKWARDLLNIKTLPKPQVQGMPKKESVFTAPPKPKPPAVIGSGRALANYSTEIHQLCRSLKDKHATEVEEMQTTEIVEGFFRNVIDKRKNIADDDCMERILDLINNQPNGYCLSIFQQMAIDRILELAAPLIFRKKSQHELVHSLKKWNMSPAETALMAMITSRRGGKTDAITMSAAVLLACVPDIEILYYSLFNPICKVACQTTAKWLRNWGLEKQGYKIRMNALSILVIAPDGNRRIIRFVNGQNKNVSTHTIYISHTSYFY